MRYLFDCWKDFLQQLKKAKVVFLFFDYDGTLTPIVKKPELATLPYKTKHLLKKLINQDWSKVAIISGRSLKDIKKLIGIKGIIYAGNHGLELEGSKLKYTNKRALMLKKYLDIIYNQLVEELKGYSKLLIEHKGLTLSVHYRIEKNKDRLKKIFKILNNITDSYVKQKKIRITHGKKVVEIKPKISWNKGKIVLWLLKYFKQNSPSKNTLSIYLGDDATDEDVFGVLRKRGIGIFVGDSKKKSRFHLRSAGSRKERSLHAGTLAKFYLSNTEQVVDFLERIIYYKNKDSFSCQN